MNLAEVAAKHVCSPSKISHLKAEALLKLGYVRVGEGKLTSYEPADSGTVEAAQRTITTLEEAKLRKLLAEVKRLEGGSRERAEELVRDGARLTLEAIREALGEYRKALGKREHKSLREVYIKCEKALGQILRNKLDGYCARL